MAPQGTQQRQRFSARFPCPICGGHEAQQRHLGLRCAGYLQGGYAHCEREERAGGLPLQERDQPPCYVHRLGQKKCRCGDVHGGEGPPDGGSGSPLGLPSTIFVDAALAGLPAHPKEWGQALYEWPYHDEQRRYLFSVVRFRLPSGDKTYRPFHREPGGSPRWGAKGIRMVPYRLPDLIAALHDDPQAVAHVVEGEKCADRLTELGLIATTAPGGAKKWHLEYGKYLQGHPVYVHEDNDNPGRRAALLEARALADCGCPVKLVQYSDLPKKGDVFDYLVEHSVDELLSRCRDTPRFRPPLDDLEIIAPPPARATGEPGDDDPRRPLFTDHRNARRFAAMWGERTRYDFTIGGRVEPGAWRIWPGETNGTGPGRAWQRDQQEEVISMAKRTVQQMYQELAQVEIAHKPQCLKEIIACESSGRSRAMLREAHELLRSTHADYDQDPYLLNTKMGTVELRTGQLREPRREDFCSKITACGYDPRMPIPRWLKFLGEVFIGDQALISYVQRLLGLSLLGKVTEHLLIVCYGTGGNGKGVFLDSVHDLLGDYSRMAAADLLLSDDRSQHPERIADLRGVRVVVASETDEGRRFNEALVKSLTGGDRRTCRELYGLRFEYIPQDTFWLMTNHKPEVRTTGEGMWRRLRLIPFDATFSGTGDDRTLRDKLRPEWPGILAWMVQGTLQYLEDVDQRGSGLTEPQRVREATQEYRREMDTLADFLDDECALGGDNIIDNKSLYNRYINWCERESQKPVSPVWFGRRLTDRPGIRRDTSRTNGRRWRGITLQDAPQQAILPESANLPTTNTSLIPSSEDSISEYERTAKRGLVYESETGLAWTNPSLQNGPSTDLYRPNPPEPPTDPPQAPPAPQNPLTPDAPITLDPYPQYTWFGGDHHAWMEAVEDWEERHRPPQEPPP